MKLVSFKKMNKQKRIIIGSIVGVLFLLGSILLIRSYALYEEDKEFNVLRGKIPDFGYDIKMLSVVVDGEKSKTIPSRGLYKTQIDCSNGTRGEWDYNAWKLTLENVSENARCNITFTSNLTEEEYDKYIEAGKALRRNTYRGKDITNYHNDGSLYEMISSGRFDDIYIGDYIIANNIKWLVADIDNYLYTGSPTFTKHHATIISADSLTTAAMNTTDTNEGGYDNSNMKQNILPNVLSTFIAPVFGTHILKYAESSGKNESQIDLMSEINVYGSIVFSTGYDIGINNRQYAIFQLKPELINSYDNKRLNTYWLKNRVDSTSFAVVDGQGYSSTSVASRSNFNVRPRFLIG